MSQQRAGWSHNTTDNLLPSNSATMNSHQWNLLPTTYPIDTYDPNISSFAPLHHPSQHVIAARSLRDCRNRTRLISSYKKHPSFSVEEDCLLWIWPRTVQLSQRCKVSIALRSPCIMIAQYVSSNKDGRDFENFCLTCISMPWIHFA